VIVARADGSTVYEVLAVRYGTRLTRKSEVFLDFASYGEPDAELRMDYFFWLARGGGRTILIDCGFNERSGGRRGRTMLCPPLAALHRLGVAPADVDTVVVSHAHYDHIGNLGAFPSAEVVISGREYGFWTGPLASRAPFAASAEDDDIGSLRRARAAGRLTVVDGRAPVTPGIDVVEVGGHTPGQLVAEVRTAAGVAVLASDAMHYYEEMTADRPFSIVADLPAMYAGFQLLRDMQAAGRILVAGHDPEVMRRFPAAGDGLAGLAVQVGGQNRGRP
jgi:glyoxylase-like metal-dependent hydrolase (beta-lactamase superfamily II)